MNKLICIQNKRVRNATAVGVLLLLSSLTANAQSLPKQSFATTRDGVRIAIQEYGDPKGAEIVLIHGLLGSHLDWIKQVNDPALRRYRLITYDLRGHGLSGKPAGAAFYSQGKRWGDELQSVIAAKGLRRPTLVGWSLGGAVMSNYLQTYGDSKIAGLVFVNAVIELKPELLQPNAGPAKAVASGDLGTHLEGTRQFVRKCFFNQPDEATFGLLYANAALASREMATTVLTGGFSIPARQALPKVRVPVVLIQGDKDALVKREMVSAGRKLMPGAKISIYAQTGHATFFERPERFNRELIEFVRAAQTTR